MHGQYDSINDFDDNNNTYDESGSEWDILLSSSNSQIKNNNVNDLSQITENSNTLFNLS